MTAKEQKAGNYKVQFGKYEGSSLWWILDEDPDYFAWMLSEICGGSALEAIQCYGNSDSVQAKLEKAAG